MNSYLLNYAKKEIELLISLIYGDDEDHKNQDLLKQIDDSLILLDKFQSEQEISGKNFSDPEDAKHLLDQVKTIESQINTLRIRVEQF